MARSIWKGPFVDSHLLKKAKASAEAGRNNVIKTWSRRSTILPEFVGLSFAVHNYSFPLLSFCSSESFIVILVKNF
ncbi:MAG: hypothetical protein CBE18_01305 [Pelagibacteraceae bacterium TMED258]|nr:MAG: hypothetical protein CBE18_01305 [Pelagibacteraceae bacterium TMED258]